MSHFTKTAQANIVDRIAFAEACKELGLATIVENTTIQSFYGEAAQKVDVLAKGSGRAAVGLQKQKDGKYGMVSDWYCMRGSIPSAYKKACGNDLSDQNMQNTLLQFTTKHTLMRSYRAKGYSVRTAEGKNGAINMVLSKS